MRILMSKQGTGAPPEGIPVIDGAQIEDSTLTVNTSGVESSSGINNETYQWYKNGIPVSTSASVLLGDSDVGAVYYVEFTYTNGYGSVFTLTSNSTSPIANVNDVPVGVPTITGTAEVGNTVTVNTSGISDADGLGSFSYQWLRNGSNIAGATSSSYTLVTADSEQLLSVKVSWTDGHGTAEYVTSTTTSVSSSFQTTLVGSEARSWHSSGDDTQLSFGADSRRSLDTWGTWTIVGAARQAGPSGAGQGAAYLYNNGTYARTFTSPSPAQYQYFGSSVGISGTHILIGNLGSSPAARLYNYSGSLIRTYTSPFPQANENFGGGVDVRSNYVAISAAFWDGNGGTSNGRVYIFDTSGTLLTTIENPEPGTNKYFGFTVKLADNNRVISTSNGRVHCHHTNGTHYWSNSGDLRSVTAMGDYVAVGMSASNLVRVYNMADGSLHRTITNPNVQSSSSADAFGSSVSFPDVGPTSQQYLVVGAPSERSQSGLSNAGVAYVFDIATGDLLTTLWNPSPSVGDQFGLTSTISISSPNMIVIGAPYEDTLANNSGSIHVYNWTD